MHIVDEIVNRNIIRKSNILKEGISGYENVSFVSINLTFYSTRTGNQARHLVGTSNDMMRELGRDFSHLLRVPPALHFVPVPAECRPPPVSIIYVIALFFK